LRPVPFGLALGNPKDQAFCLVSGGSDGMVVHPKENEGGGERRPFISIGKSVIRSDVKSVRRRHRGQALMEILAAELRIWLGDCGFQQSQVQHARIAPVSVDFVQMNL
jgi:hypothetical protein